MTKATKTKIIESSTTPTFFISLIISQMFVKIKERATPVGVAPILSTPWSPAPDRWHYMPQSKSKLKLGRSPAHRITTQEHPTSHNDSLRGIISRTIVPEV